MPLKVTWYERKGVGTLLLICVDGIRKNYFDLSTVFFFFSKLMVFSLVGVVTFSRSSEHFFVALHRCPLNFAARRNFSALKATLIATHCL
jgi:hypothetical protein